MRRAKIALIVEPGINIELDREGVSRIGTPFGPSSKLKTGRIGAMPVVEATRNRGFLRPEEMRRAYLSDIWAIRSLGVEGILACSSLRSLREDLKVGSFMIPSDVIDLSILRETNMSGYLNGEDGSREVQYCTELRENLIRTGRRHALDVEDKGVYACINLSRIETPAEARAARALGGDAIGLTPPIEGVLSFELGMCYAQAGLVTDARQGGGRSEELLPLPLQETNALSLLLSEAVKTVPDARRCSCR